jgi:hypothetical protein
VSGPGAPDSGCTHLRVPWQMPVTECLRHTYLVGPNTRPRRRSQRWPLNLKTSRLQCLTPLASLRLIGSAHDTKMKTTGKKAIGLSIPGGVMSGDFSEKADCSQRMVFFKSSLARLQVAVRLGDAIRVQVKQLASNSRFATRRFLYTRMYLSVYVVYVHVCACMWLYIYKLEIKMAKYEFSHVYVCARISLYLAVSCCMSCDSCLAFFFAVSLGCFPLGYFHDDVRSEPGSWLVVGMIPVFDKKPDMGIPFSARSRSCFPSRSRSGLEKSLSDLCGAMKRCTRSCMPPGPSSGWDEARTFPAR